MDDFHFGFATSQPTMPIPPLWSRLFASAAAARGSVEPNPLVAAAIVREGRVIGEGRHERLGGPHAEVNALADARRRGEDPAGATVMVTLEPCAHHGKTPPCADALIAAGVARVEVAMVDPDPRVGGRGIEQLRAAGIEVVMADALCSGVEAAARRLNEPFIRRVTTGLPWTIAKWAQTLDGCIASRSGHSRWISGGASRQRVHELRGIVDAVVVGVGTAIHDDPLLTARGVEVRRVARRIVVDPDLRLPPAAKLLHDAGPPITLAVREATLDRNARRVATLRERGVEVLGLPLMDDVERCLDLTPLLRHLVTTHAATNILVEGGATLLGTLFRQGLIDRVLAFVAPKVAGDDDATPAVRGLTAERMSDAMPLELVEVERVGEDVLLDYRVRRGG